MKNDSTVLIVGHGDCVEAGLFSCFSRLGVRVLSSVRLGIDVLDRAAVEAFFFREHIDYVILTSMRSGGIGANQAYPAEFMFENLQAQNNVIDVSFRRGVKKLLYLAASCVYPRDCPQPMKEEYFMTGLMEKTSEPYSMAKAAGIVLCQAYRKQYGFSAIIGIPATVYGSGSDELAQDAHVLDALVKKVREALQNKSSELVLWGTGTPRREFIHADDLARACVFLLGNYNEASPVNIGAGNDMAIRDLADLVAKAAGYSGRIAWDSSKPDGAPRKLLDTSRLSSLGWHPEVSLAQGIEALFR